MQKAIYLRQCVKLTGFDTEMFNCAVESIVLVHTMFSRLFKEGLFENWQPSAFGGTQAIDMSNRYFTSRRRDPQAVSIPIHKEIDPHGILLELAGDDLVHCAENEVLYYEVLGSGGEQNERLVYYISQYDWYSPYAAL